MSRAAENPRAEAAREGKTFPLFLLLEIRERYWERVVVWACWDGSETENDG